MKAALHYTAGVASVANLLIPLYDAAVAEAEAVVDVLDDEIMEASGEALQKLTARRLAASIFLERLLDSRPMLRTPDHGTHTVCTLANHGATLFIGGFVFAGTPKSQTAPTATILGACSQKMLADNPELEAALISGQLKPMGKDDEIRHCSVMYL